MRTAIGPIAIEYAGLADIDEIEPRRVDDEDCLSEVRAVLEKHGKLGRFGMFLLHSHFPIAPDEILVEHVDRDTRTLTSRPVKRESLKGETLVETSWRLDRTEALDACARFCIPGGQNKPHGQVHQPR